MLDWLTGRSLLALKKDGFHHLMITCLFLLIGPRSGLVSKGRIFWQVAFSILALSNKGGGEGSDPCQDFSGGIDLQYLQCANYQPNWCQTQPKACTWFVKDVTCISQIANLCLYSDQPAACKPSPGWTSLLQLIIQMERPLANDHPDGTASCKWSGWTSRL